MKGMSLAKLLITAVVIALVGYVAYSGVTLFYDSKTKQSFSVGSKHIRQGLDLKGGVYVVFEPKTDKAVTIDELASTKQVIRKRLDYKGLFDANVTIDSANGRLIVEIPGETDPQKAVAEIGKTAKLQFKDSDGKVIIEGNDIVDAQSDYAGGGNSMQKAGWVVKLKFSPQAAVKFAEATERVSKLPSPKNEIGIYLDDKQLSSPVVEKRIDGGEAIIEGKGYTADSTKEEAAIIRSGALPFSLNSVQLDAIGPTLGQQALKTSLLAGAIAFGLVCLFMLLWYRLPGIVADIALVAHVAVTVLILSALKITLTLPGIAGIILSVGMAVDANILIFERVKEELKSGKTLRGAVDIGFKRAFKTIVDANITTIIVGVVLYMLGTGPIQGFAVTLTLGVLLSFLSAITLTRYLLIQVMGLGLKHTWLYGYKGGSVNA
ncbi:MAG: protein translocase subunit SecD [Deltaproteobacteria bacterium]